MNELQISNQELSRLTDEAIGLAKEYWESVEQRPAYPVTSGKQTTELFARPWAEEGLGRDVLQDFKTIAEHARPSGGKFFGYVLGSGEPVGALGELLAAALNQNVTSWRSAPAAVDDRARRRRLAGGGGRLRRLLRQPVRRRLDGKPDGAGHGAGSEAARQRDGCQARHRLCLRAGAHVDPEGGGAPGHRPQATCA